MIPQTPKATRVFNITRNAYVRFNQARRAVENLECAWVDVGFTIRNLTLAETFAAQEQRKRDQCADCAKGTRKCPKHREWLPYAEIHGIKYEAREKDRGSSRQSRLLAYEAALFVEAVQPQEAHT